MELVRSETDGTPTYNARFDDGSEIPLAPALRLVIARMARRRRLEEIRSVEELAAAVAAYCVKRARFHHRAAVLLPQELLRQAGRSTGEPRAVRASGRAGKARSRRHIGRFVSWALPLRREPAGGVQPAQGEAWRGPHVRTYSVSPWISSQDGMLN